jgi:hypothetical protein
MAACRRRGEGGTHLASKAFPAADGRNDRPSARGIMIRFGFNIRTRTGQRVDNISIMAGSQGDAERRLRQMYLHCEIIDCREQSVPRRVDTRVVERVIGLIAAGPASIQKARAV